MLVPSFFDKLTAPADIGGRCCISLKDNEAGGDKTKRNAAA